MIVAMKAGNAALSAVCSGSIELELSMTKRKSTRWQAVSTPVVVASVVVASVVVASPVVALVPVVLVAVVGPPVRASVAAVVDPWLAPVWVAVSWPVVGAPPLPLLPGSVVLVTPVGVDVGFQHLALHFKNLRRVHRENA